MHRRLISSVVGGVIGIGLAWRFQDSLGLSKTVTYAAFVLGGIALAWVASMLFDVFAGTPSGAPDNPSAVKPPDARSLPPRPRAAK